MRVLSVVGARPQFVKLAPVAQALAVAGAEHVIVHTGQHYDAAMSDVFFADLTIPAPDVHLAVGSGSHADQTAAMLTGLAAAFEERRPDWVLVYGDTNSTLAAALAAVKLHVPVAHLEAGLRSFNRRMPEEHNRVLTDHAADLLLAPTDGAMVHLAAEGLADRSVLVGDVMTDVCLTVRDAVLAQQDRTVPGLPAEEHLVATVHRADNTDDPERLERVVRALADLPLPVVLVAHPRLRARCAQFGIDLDQGNLRTIAPLSYQDMVIAMMGSRGVVTDSGGLQKEAYLLGVPCATLRSETEWPETLRGGWNVVVDDPAALASAALRELPHAERPPVFGDGHAATRTVEVLGRAQRPTATS